MSVAVLDQLSAEAMFRAVEQADASYDGVFFFGVTTTGVFCFPSCTCRKPRRKNVRFFRTRAEALAAGFRPCKRCHSDRDGGRRGYESELVEQVRTLVGERLDTVTIEELAAEIGLSSSYLMRLFRQNAGISLQRYIRARRVARAAELLRTRRQTVLQVAGQVGFESTSAFYTAFRQVVGCPPGEYRHTVLAGGRN